MRPRPLCSAVTALLTEMGSTMQTCVQFILRSRRLRGVVLAAVGDWIYADDHDTMGGLQVAC